MLERVVINIAGGHHAGGFQVTQEIKHRLKEIFKYQIRIVNLDDLATTPSTYSDKDYDFERIMQEIESAGSPGALVIELVCGCYALYDTEICGISSLKVFVDSDGDKRLINLIQSRDVETPDALESCISHYLDHLRPEMIKYIEPSKTNADIIIPSSNDALGIAIIVDGIVKVVEQYEGGNHNEHRKLFPQLDFNLERMELEKDRYYDLS